MKEFFAGTMNQFRLWVKEVQIHLLNSRLDCLKEDRLFGWEVDDEEIQNIIEGLESLSVKYNEILARIRACNEKRNKGEVAQHA